jgi:hypothetical protein
MHDLSLHMTNHTFQDWAACWLYPLVFFLKHAPCH